MGCYKYGNWLETLMKHSKKYYNKGLIKRAALPPFLPICSSILSEYILWSFDKTNLSPLPASPFPARRTNCYLWLYYCSLCAKSLQLCPALCDPIAWIPSDSLRPWDFPGKNTGVGCHFLLQGSFLTRGLNPCLLYLLHWQAGFYHQRHLV